MLGGSPPPRQPQGGGLRTGLDPPCRSRSKSPDLPEEATDIAVSIVVPVRNEADNIALLIAEIAAALDGRWAYEIVYVNDGSTDATAERLAAARAQRANVR